MHPRIEELFAGLDRDRAVLAAAVESVPVLVRERRAIDDRWSVAEILEHLSLVETGVSRILTAKIAQGRAAGLAEETDSSPLPHSKRLATIREGAHKMTAPDRLVPRAGLTAADAWLALARSREALRTAALTGDGLALATISYLHPFAGPFNMYQWIAFVGAHEALHATQIREIAGV